MLVNQSDVPRRLLPEVSDEEMASEEAGFALDLTQQIEQLRVLTGLTQADLAAAVGTHQQQVSRLEDPEYQPSVRMLRKVARALRAYLDITLVPHERLEGYFQRRYQPVLHDQPDPLADSTRSLAQITAGNAAPVQPWRGESLVGAPLVFARGSGGEIPSVPVRAVNLA